MYELNGIIVANTISSSCLWLTSEKGINTTTTESLACGYWVDMGSARETKS